MGVPTNNSQLGQFCLPRGYLTRSTDIFDCQDFGGWGVATGIYEVEARDTVEHPTKHSMGLTTNNCLAHKVNGVTPGKP